MAFLRRQKAVIAVLVLYWPTLFVLAHIPIPPVVRRAHMNDKSLHLLAYMILTFLLWSAIKPGERVRWRRIAVWCLLTVVAVYGVCDEWLQRVLGSRSMDPSDLIADLIGAVAALGILTVLSFWPTCVVVTGTTIYTLAVFTQALAVISRQDHGIVVGDRRLQNLTDYLVQHFHRFDHRGGHRRVADHVAVGEIHQDESVLVGFDGAHHGIRHFVSAHFRF